MLLLPSLREMMTARLLLGSSSRNYVNQHHDNGNDEQDMNEPSHRIAAYQSEEPQGYQYHGNCPQHNILLEYALVSLRVCENRIGRQRSRVYLDSLMVICFFMFFALFTSFMGLVSGSIIAVSLRGLEWIPGTSTPAS